MLQDGQKRVEGLHVARFGGVQGGFNKGVAGDDERGGRFHPCGGFLSTLCLLIEPRMPAGFPGGKGLGGKQGFGAIQIVAILAVPIQREAHEGVGVVGFVIQHQLQQVDGQQLVAGGHFCILRGEEPQLLAHAPGVAGLELAGEGVQFLLGHVDGFVLIVTEER